MMFAVIDMSEAVLIVGDPRVEQGIDQVHDKVQKHGHTGREEGNAVTV